MSTNKIPVISTTKLEKIKECNASENKPKLKVNAGSLTRWLLLNDAISDWFHNDAPDETVIKKAENEHFNYFDPLQKRILSDMFDRFRTLYPKKKANIQTEYLSNTVFKNINGEEHGIGAYSQYEITDKGKTDNIKLKTGDPEISLIDRAIITSEKLDNETYYAASIRDMDLIEIEDLENYEDKIDEYFDIYEDFVNNPEKTKPGQQCVSLCNQQAACGEFPIIEGDSVNTAYRGIKITKKYLTAMDKCDRRAAWGSEYSIPKDNEEPFERNFGSIFHDYAQQMLVGNKNRHGKDEIKKFSLLIEKEEEEIQKKLIEKYQELLKKLEKYENLEIKKSEYPLGFTIFTEGVVVNKNMTFKNDGKVVTTFLGKTDLSGDLDGTPIVIELKTGKREEREELLEAQLYGLGASKQSGKDKVIVLHIYLNDKKDEPVFRNLEESEFNDIERKFQSIAEKVASWHPSDALSPNYSLGDWCKFCDFQETCAEFR